ncbi:MAG: hypothetical protein JKY37_30645 [Nannocystaceae bacterium]|nr:hypothetical protein [Nannocystaceae bacterium]
MLSARVRRFAVATSLACSLGLGCKPNEGPVEPVAEPVSAAGVVVGDGEVVRVSHPAQMLPRDTQFVAWVAGADRLAEVFDRDGLAAKFPSEFEAARAEMVGEIGVDLLDPGAYAAAGIDSKGRMGAALISTRDGVVAFFFTLADAGKFKARLREVAAHHKEELAERQVGPSTVLSDARGQWRGGFVLRDDLAMFVTQANPDEGVRDYAEAVANIDPRQSLAASVEYRKALGGLRDSDAMAFFNPALLVADELAQEDARDSVDNNWAETALTEAKARDASADEIAELERQRDEMRVWDEQRVVRAAAGRELVEKLVDGIEGVGVALSVKRTGPVLDGQIVLREGAFLRQLIGVVPEGMSLPKALNGEPLLMWGGRVDVDAALELVELLARSEGASIHDASIQAEKAMLGINPTTDLQPLLTGEAMLAVTLEAPVDYAHLDELAKQIGFTLQLKIKDPAKVEALLAKIDKSATLAGFALSKKNGAYEFSVPRFRTMRAVVAGDSLLVTTDAGLAGRLATGVEGSMRRDTHPAGPYHVLTLPNVGGVWSTNLGYIAGFFVTGFASSSMAVFHDSAVDGGPSWSEVEKSRMSRAAKQKKKALDAAESNVEKAVAAFTGAQTKMMADGVLALGTTAFVVQPNTRGFSLAGGQFIGADSLGGVVDAMLTMIAHEASGTDRGALTSAENERDQLSRDYRALRIKDWERANKGGRGKSKVKTGKPVKRKSAKSAKSAGNG